MAAKRTLVIDQGATRRVRLRWLASREPVKMSSWRGCCQLRPAPRSNTLYDELSTENGRMTLSDSGEITLLWPPEVTAGFDFGSACCDVLLISPDGTVTRLVEISIAIAPRVTQLNALDTEVTP